MRPDADHPSFADSARIEGGRFVLTGRVEGTRMARLATRRGATPVVLEGGGTTSVNFAAPTGIAVSGTRLNDIHRNNTLLVNTIERSFTNTIKDNKLSADSAYNLYRRYEVLLRETYRLQYDENPRNILGVNALLSLADLGGGEAEARRLLHDLPAPYNGYARVAKLLPTLDSAAATAVGRPYRDVVAGEGGRPQRLSDYAGRGHYVLVDFWASWCGPCRAEIPFIKQAAERFGSKGLTVVGIAAWDKPADTRRAMKELGITWPVLLNTQSAGTASYGIRGIPELLLIAPDGTIAARGMRGEEMLRTVEHFVAAPQP